MTILSICSIIVFILYCKPLTGAPRAHLEGTPMNYRMMLRVLAIFAAMIGCAVSQLTDDRGVGFTISILAIGLAILVITSSESEITRMKELYEAAQSQGIMITVHRPTGQIKTINTTVVLEAKTDNKLIVDGHRVSKRILVLPHSRVIATNASVSQLFDALNLERE